VFNDFGYNLRSKFRVFHVNYFEKRQTRPSSCTQVSGMSASMSMTFAIDAGIASYVGAGATATEDGTGRDAARAAAIDVAAIFF